MDDFLIKNRVVNQEALDEFIADLPITFVCHTWPKEFQKAALKAYTEFIELKVVFQDWNLASIVAPYPVRHLWKMHAAHYNGLCQKLFKNIIVYKKGKTSAEQVQFTLKAYFMRFNHSPCKNIWDFDLNKELWKYRITNWDKLCVSKASSNFNELAICKKSCLDIKNINDQHINSCQKQRQVKQYNTKQTKKQSNSQSNTLTTPSLATRSNIKKMKIKHKENV
ncbi:uncharacterized protein LOC124813195 [Hydra vulgaris]|uniref:uncharacterized protein LOC124813195 n=1 Tax=Hydra vulgaris TaxID=6087 RepID=UPI001F5ECA45|nr:uncharacterized protein LOC124813195 [Hydra vulgaris]